MKTDFLTIVAALAFAAIPGASANPSPLPMGVEITERDGVTLVREVKVVPLTISTDSLTTTSELKSDAESAFILAAVAPLVTEAAMVLSTEAAPGVEIIASLFVSQTERAARSGVCDRLKYQLRRLYRMLWLLMEKEWRYLLTLV
ncbi:hypothetical protein QQS21_001208 [Conoideocrella luteorostrata]|uniref:Uncharacterized protein n=1 Tax=Conoideocrella luteorostrata TaxID=1105319 RepID=A0AAJ0D0W6_9HYPO|nr:hypothetical protein QQS21_001208 [Conoideocrella luteorostrata]